MKDSLTKLFGSHLIDLSILPDNPVIIDAGACVGHTVRHLQSHIKDPSIFAIEPNTANIKELKQIEGIVVVEAALVAEKEPREMRFYEIERLPEWGNVTNLYTNKKHKSYLVETISLKALLATIPLETIHYLKMDIEGSEWDVVKDMDAETVERIEQLSMELHVHPIEITKRLELLGYKTFKEKGELYAVRKEL
ncbi:MAG: FkbM family methyltransferase [Candidatus Scalindua sp.]